MYFARDMRKNKCGSRSSHFEVTVQVLQVSSRFQEHRAHFLAAQAFLLLPLAEAVLFLEVDFRLHRVQVTLAVVRPLGVLAVGHFVLLVVFLVLPSLLDQPYLVYRVLVGHFQPRAVVAPILEGIAEDAVLDLLLRSRMVEVHLIDHYRLSLRHAVLLGLRMAVLEAGLGVRKLDEHERQLLPQDVDVLLQDLVDHVLHLDRSAVAVVDLVLYLQDLLALLDELLQVVEALLGADLVEDDAEEEFELFGEEVGVAVRVGQQAAPTFVEKVEEKRQFFGVVGSCGVEVPEDHALLEVRL